MPETQVGQQVGGRVLGRPPGVAAQDRLVVPVRVGHGNILTVPELPEMQALAERLHALASGHVLRGSSCSGFSSLKTYAPPVDELSGRRWQRLTRRAKYLVWTFSGDRRGSCCTSRRPGRARRGSCPPKRTRPRGAVARFVFAGRRRRSRAHPGLLVREHGTQRKASWWVLAAGDEGPLAGLGPEAGSRANSPSWSAPAPAPVVCTPICATSTWWRASVGAGGTTSCTGARSRPSATLGSLTRGAAGATDRCHHGGARRRRWHSSAHGTGGCPRPSWADGSPCTGGSDRRARRRGAVSPCAGSPSSRTR